jgi:serine/threonine-protein kinase RsbT
MARNDAASNFSLPRRQKDGGLVAWHKAQAPVPAVRTGMTTLEILGLKSGSAVSLGSVAKPARQQPPSIQEITILQGNDVIRARQSAREMAQELGFEIVDQIYISTATCELSRNVYQYSGQGKVTIKPVSRHGARGIEIVVEDRGPGIPDIEQVLQNGFSPRRGRGHGLPGTRRLMDEFDIHSQVGVGTTVKMMKWLK